MSAQACSSPESGSLVAVHIQELKEDLRNDRLT